MECVLPINTVSPEDSNLFLRCLWAELRTEFGKLGWLYFGGRHKASNEYIIGWADIGLAESLFISFNYKTAGTINQLMISGIEQEDVLLRLKSAINRAQDYQSRISSADVGLFMGSFRQLESFTGKNFQIACGTRNVNQLRIHKISNFDQLDMEQEALIQGRNLMILLSVAFNTNIWNSHCRFESRTSTTSDFIHKLILIDSFLSIYTSRSREYRGVLNAAKLIKYAIIINYANGKIEDRESRLEQNKYKIGIENAIVNFISAIETLAGINAPIPDVCSHCSQKIYKLSQSVRDFSCNLIGNQIDQILKESYAIRSQIVHQGMILETNDIYNGQCAPRFDLLRQTEMLTHVSGQSLEIEDICNVLFFKYLESVI